MLWFIAQTTDFKNLAKAGVVSGICYPPAKAGGNSARAGGNLEE